MDVLLLTPPVCMPAEPAAGAFTLAAALTGAGVDVALLDLSLAFYRRVLGEAVAAGTPGVRAALAHLMDAPGGYDLSRHRTDLGHLHRALRRVSVEAPGWRLSLMDATPPVPVHAPAALAAHLRESGSPFRTLWCEVLDPVLERERPAQVLVSLAYLSQLPATLDLVAHLRARGVRPRVGGSLVRSLASTGNGLDSLRGVLPGLDPDDGVGLLRELLGPHRPQSHHPQSHHLQSHRPRPHPLQPRRPQPRLADPLARLAWPRLLGEAEYLSARPILPIPLSVGCYWRKCLFCPDREMPFRRVGLAALEQFLESLPAPVRRARPVLHLLDSALPPAATSVAADLFRAHGVGFYGFARPTRAWLKQDRLGGLAEAGALMLQLGVESGSGSLLARYQKGVVPREAEAVLDAAAEAGIRTYVYLLFGLPGETPADRVATRALLDRHPDAVDFLNVSLFNLPRHSELADRADELGLALQASPAERKRSEEGVRLYWAFRYQGTDPRDEARRFLGGEFRGSGVARAAQGRTPRWLRAAHLALMRLPGRRSP